jgi:ribosomal protein S18 acetylase RimI-like enzyme
VVVTSGFTIRDARPAEYATVGDLVVEAYRDTGEADESYFSELTEVAERAAQVPVLVAVDDATGAVLGTVTYVPGPGPFHEGEFGDAATFRMLAVAAGARGRGVGQALVETCIERARAAGRQAVAIYTRPFMTAAQRMYERLGFERLPDLDWEYETNEWLLAYRLDLG